MHASDLPIYDEKELLGLLDGHLIRAYHCTRLLDHERAMIFEQGLRPLDVELVTDRITRAHEAGAITDAERRAFEIGHQFVLSGWEERVKNTENQVCLVLSRTTFDHDSFGVEPLLSTWGGEAIYFGIDAVHGEGSKLGKRIRAMGKPSIVVANLDLSAQSFGLPHCIFPALGACFVGKRLELEGARAEIMYKAPVLAGNVVEVWHPGSAAYDQHGGLPR